MKSDIAITVIALTIIVIASLTIVARALGLNPRMYEWDRQIGMATNTAVCFLLVAVGLLVLMFKSHRKGFRKTDSEVLNDGN